MAPPPVQQVVVPNYAKSVDDLRTKVLKAAGIFRPYDPEVYPQVRLRLHGAEEIDLYLHNAPTVAGVNHPPGWFGLQKCLDDFLPLYKRQDEDRKILARAPIRIGRTITDPMSVSPEERGILLMSNKEYGALGYRAPAPPVAPAAIAAPAMAGPSMEGQGKKIAQLEAMIASLQDQILSGPPSSPGKRVSFEEAHGSAKRPISPPPKDWADDEPVRAPVRGSPPRASVAPKAPDPTNKSGPAVERKAPPPKTTL